MPAVVVILASWQDVEVGSVRRSAAAQHGVDAHDVTLHILPLAYDDEEARRTAYDLMKMHRITSLPMCLVTDPHSHADDHADAYADSGSSIRTHPLVASERVSECDEVETVQVLAEQALAAYESFDITLAARCYHRLLLKDPSHKTALFNIASLFHMMELPLLAVHYMERLLGIDPEDMVAHTFFWALANAEDAATSAAVIDSYRRLAANDLKAAHKLAALTGEGDYAASGDPNYAKRIYNDMAERFESKLVDHLGYRGPWILQDMVMKVLATTQTANRDTDMSSSLPDSCEAEADAVADAEAAHLQSLSPAGQWRILDVGCGSGLCGKVFQRFVRPDGDGDGDGGDGGADTVANGQLVNSASAEGAAGVGAIEGESGDQEHSSGSRGVDDDDDDDKDDGIPDVASVSALADDRYRAGPLFAGIDVSERMVDISIRTNYYDVVVCGDLREALSVYSQGPVPGLQGEGFGRLDMVISADTFIYVGVLGSVFAAVNRALKNGGLFIFSVEDLDSSPMQPEQHTSQRVPAAGCDNAYPPPSQDALTFSRDGEPVGAVPGWGGKLLTSARFAHSQRYIDCITDRHGFVIMDMQKHPLRSESATTLMGLFYVLQKVDR